MVVLLIRCVRQLSSDAVESVVYGKSCRTQLVDLETECLVGCKVTSDIGQVLKGCSKIGVWYVCRRGCDPPGVVRTLSRIG